MINLNGNLTAEPHFSPQNRALLYGDAVFETVRCQGGKIYFWEDHYFRLMSSMRILRMDIPMLPETLCGKKEECTSSTRIQSFGYTSMRITWSLQIFHTSGLRGE